MSSIFRFTSVRYFQIPKSLIETGVWADLIPSARDLYMLLLYLADRNSSQVLSVTTADAAKVGLSVNAVKNARENLIDHKLIAAARKRNGYTYELLNPTGGSLERIENIAKVDPEIVEEHFLEHLAAYDAEELHQAIRCHCPFHEIGKDRDHPLHVTFTDGGAFTCHRCKVSGGIVDFEIAIARKNGETLDRDRAWGRVRESLLSAGRRRDRRKAEEIARARAML